MLRPSVWEAGNTDWFPWISEPGTWISEPGTWISKPGTWIGKPGMPGGRPDRRKSGCRCRPAL